jgi:hypothetical protein
MYHPSSVHLFCFLSHNAYELLVSNVFELHVAELAECCVEIRDA